MCLAEGHNSVMLVSLEPATSRPRVKHSTTALPQRLLSTCDKYQNPMCWPKRLLVLDLEMKLKCYYM